MTLTCMTRSLLVLLAISLAGCVDLQRRLEYDNLDEVARDATGVELWEMEFGDKEVNQVRERLGKTRTASLYCIRDNVDGHMSVPGSLSKEQGQQRVENIRLLLKRALIPVIELREMEANQQALRSGCNYRR